MTDFDKELEMASEKQLEELGKFDKNEGYYENTSDDATFNWPMFEFVSSIVFPVLASIGLCFLAFWLYWHFRVRRGRRGDVEMRRVEYTNTGSQASVRCAVRHTQTDEEEIEELAAGKKLTDESNGTDFKKLTVENPRKTERQDSSAMQCDEDDDDDNEEDEDEEDEDEEDEEEETHTSTITATISPLHTSQTELVGVSEPSVNWFGSVGTVLPKGAYIPLPREETLTDIDTQPDDEHYV